MPSFRQNALASLSFRGRLKDKVDAGLHLARHPTAATPNAQAEEILTAVAGFENELSALTRPTSAWLASLSHGHLFGEDLHRIGSLLDEIHAAEWQAVELEQISALAKPLIQYFKVLHQQPPSGHQGTHQGSRASLFQLISLASASKVRILRTLCPN